MAADTGGARLEGVSIVTAFDDLPDKWLRSLRGAGIVACDIETSGLNWDEDRIATCQLYAPSKPVVVVRINEEPPKNLCSLIEDTEVKKVFHHAMFDLRFMHYRWELAPTNVACTKIASKLLDPRNEHSHSLKLLLEGHLGVTLDKKEQLSDWFSPTLTEAQLLYAAGDVVYLISLLSQLERALESVGLLELARACYGHIPTRVQLDILGYQDVFVY